MNRLQLVEHLTKDFTGIFVEIGTDSGSFAENLLVKTRCSKLYCVDPYVRYEKYRDAINNITGDARYNDAKARLSKWGDRVEFVRTFSADASAMLPDNLDMVYIDGNHDYKFVLEDLKFWYPKVKSGGYIIGDDAVDTDESERGADNNVFIEWSPGCYGNYGVIKALKDFCTENSLKYELVDNQFVIVKNP